MTDRDIALAVARHEELAGLAAEGVMTRDPATVRGDAGAVELPARMAEARVRRVPVVDGEGRPTGIATLDDVVATVGEELDDIATVIEAQFRGYSPD